MSLQVINTGTSPNAGNGDSIRSAFNKVNQNFNLLNGMILGTSTNFNSGVRSVVKPMLVHNSHNGITASYNSINDRIILSLDVGDATFNNIQVNNNSTFNNVAITGTVNIGIIQGFDDVNIIKFANVDQSLNLRIKNTWGLGSSEINLLDDTEGGLNIVHQNSSGNQGILQFGQNYIYDETTKALNIGRRGNINFYADQGWSSYDTPTVSISNTGTVNVQTTLTLAKNFISLDGNILSVTNNTVSVNGINIVREPDKLIAGDYQVVLNTSGNIILPGSSVIAYSPYGPPGQTVTNYGVSFSLDGPFVGAGSINFNGLSRIEVAGGDPFDLTTGTYTIEWFQKPTILTATNVYTVLSLGTIDQQIVEVNNFYNEVYTATSAVIGGSFQLDGIYNTEILNTWTHVALVKTTSSFSVFINGVQTVSTNTGLFPVPAATTTNLTIGSPVFFVNYSPYVGLISNMRWEAREVYNTGFVPPSSILTASTFTRLLLAPTTPIDFLWDTSGTKQEIPQNLSWQVLDSSLTLDSQGVLKLDQNQSYDNNDLDGTTFRIDTDQPNYTQIYVKNHNQGTTATSDLVIFNNTTTEDTGYIDLGINSTNYNEGVYGLHGPGSGYLFTKDVDLVVGTQGLNTRLLFHAGGDTVNDSAGELNEFYWKFNRSVQTIVSTPGPLNFTVWNTQNNSAAKAVYQAMNNSGEYVHLGINSSNAGAFYGNIGPSDSFIHNHETTSTLHIGAQGNLVFYSDQVNGFYGTPTLIMSRLDRTSTFAGHVLPAEDLTYDLGSSSTQWRSLYVGTSTIYIGGVPITVNVETKTLIVGSTPGTTSTTTTNLATEAYVINYVTQNAGGGGDGYTPAEPLDWVGTPTTVAAALDELASRMTAFQNYEVDGGNAFTEPVGELNIDGGGA